MLDVSSPGRALPKTKTINVEANLLAERREWRRRLHADAARLLAMYVAVICLAVVALPIVNSARLHTIAESNQAERELAEVNKRLEASEAKLAEYRPRMNSAETMNLVAKHASESLGQLLFVLNAAQKEVVFDKAKIEVTTGSASMNFQGEAISSDATQLFIDRASEGPKVSDAFLVSTKSSTSLGPDSITFQFVKKVSN